MKEDYSVLIVSREDGWGTFSVKKDKKKKRETEYYNKKPPLLLLSLLPSPLSRSSTLWQAFLDLKLTYQHHYIEVLISDPGSYQLLYHAKLYVFAERYLIDYLKTCYLVNLYTKLRNFELTVEIYTDILNLLSFTYANTGRRGFLKTD